MFEYILICGTMAEPRRIMCTLHDLVNSKHEIEALFAFCLGGVLRSRKLYHLGWFSKRGLHTPLVVSITKTRQGI